MATKIELARLMTWFGSSRQWWSVGVVAALIAALTEVLVVAVDLHPPDLGTVGDAER